MAARCRVLPAAVAAAAVCVYLAYHIPPGKRNLAALSRETIRGLRQGQVNLDDPAVALALLRQNAVVGVTGFFDGSGRGGL